MAARTLAVGFVLAIVITTLGVLVGRALGWVVLGDVVGPRPGTAFIYSPDRWSFLVAIIAGSAGMLSLTSARLGGLSGVFISVTTVPAAGNVALGLAFGVGDAIWGSTLQLVVNIAGMAVAGWATLALQQVLRSRVTLPRSRVGRREAGAQDGEFQGVRLAFVLTTLTLGHYKAAEASMVSPVVITVGPRRTPMIKKLPPSPGTDRTLGN